MLKNLFYKIIFPLALLFSSLVSAQKDTMRTEEIEEVVMNRTKKIYKTKKENPAYAIMQEVWKRKRTNGLENYDSYRFKEYEKIQFDISNIDSAFMARKVFKKLDFIFDYADSADNGLLALPLFLNEAIYKNSGQNKPTKKTKRLLTAQKTSGFQQNQIVSLTAKNLYRDFNIYDDTINFFDIGFQSPVSKTGFSTYDYELQDTLFVNGQESYKIRYDPKRKDVLAFQGYLYISTEHFAVVQATLRSTKKINVNFVNGIFTELTFDNPDDKTFLRKKYVTKIELSPISKGKNAKGLLASRTVNYSDYEFNSVIAPEELEEREEELDPEFSKKEDAFWDTARTDSLSTKEKNIYKMLDQLEETPRFNRLVKLYETLASGYYNVGNAIDLGSIYSIYGQNEVEGSRIRLGARTYFGRNDTWRIEGFGAYGFKDDQFKYGLEGQWMLNKINRFTIGGGTARDIVQLGVQLTTDDGILNRSFASSTVFARGENASLSSVNKTNIFTSIEPWKNYQLRLDGTLQSIISANPENFNLNYIYNGTDLRKTVNDSHISLSLIARPGAKFSTYGLDRYEHSALTPTLVLKYTRGIQGLFNADFTYNKLQFLYFHPFLLGSWGKTNVNIEAGKNFDTVPLALQNIIPGNQTYGLSKNTFAQLNYYEFVADDYATLHFEHHFNGKILSFIPLIKKLKLREVGFFRAAYGTLSDASKNINLDGYRYSAPSEKVYFEYGFGIENIGFGNIRILRVDFNWRGNYLDRPDISKFGVKAGFQFSF